jgi:UDP-3-O-[3-hydroxymyristoyl] glucosamine N-acyltransferase
MEFSASQIAAIVNGEIIGSSSVIVTDLAKIEEGQEGTLSFLSNPKYEEFIYTTKSSICIVNKDFIAVKPLPLSLTLIKVENSYTCFAQLLELYDNLNKKEAKIEQPSFIDNSAVIGSDLYLGAFSYIGKNVEIGNKVVIYPNVYLGDNVKIGSNTVLHPGVSIYFGCKVGENCIIHAGTVVGSDGFGFAPNSEGVFQKIPQIGNVIIENNVEIGSNCAIDRATMGSTFIREGVKIDNLCQIAHNVDIGENSALAALVAVAGSAKIGKRVMIGGQAAINGHLSIADDTKIVGQSGVVKTVKEAVTLMGTPAIPLNDFKKSSVGFRKLPFILSKLEEIEKKLKDLE